MEQKHFKTLVEKHKGMSYQKASMPSLRSFDRCHPLGTTFLMWEGISSDRVGFIEPPPF